MLSCARIVVMLLGCSMLYLTACSKVGSSGLSKAQPLATPYSLPAEAYLGLANRQAGDERSALMIMAAGRAVYEGRWQQAQQWLDALPALPPIQDAEKHILLAKIQTLQAHPQEAIRQLSAAHGVNQLPLFYQVQYHEMLAYAYDATARYPEAIGERIILDKLLPTEAEKIRNRRVMWLTLTSLPDAELNTMMIEWPDSQELNGWLKLAQIAKAPHSNGAALLEQVRTWQYQYPQHPAQSVLPRDILSGKMQLYPAPKHIALLLPMTGALSGPGQAVYDGFMAAQHQFTQGAEAAQVRVYDTAAGNVVMLYDRAIAEGADFIIGPLSKPDVAKVAALQHPVPTLLLNDAERSIDQHTYLFTLSPLSEARQVATKARQQGGQHALIIAPTGRWGDEVMQAFEQQWARQGGKVTDVLRYDSSTPLDRVLREFLHYSEPLASSHSKGEPSRRQDFDTVFLVAYPSKAREIMPLLRYYYLGSVPVFATSAVYAGSPDPKQDRDLEGIVFCDMPFVFSQDLPNKHWPEQFNSYSRLYALGMDSYALTHQLNALVLFPALGVDDKSGVLYLNHDHQIVRLLAWGQFRQGQVKTLSSASQSAD